MIASTKEYMADRLVRPVLKRADSVKKMRDAVLDGSMSVYAAQRLDGAIDAADMYVERFLPADQAADPVDGAPADEADGSGEAVATEVTPNGESCRAHTLRFSKKLKRRLTQRTISEARALQHGSREAVHIGRYAAELLVRDPRQAARRATELWRYLSADEPDNQARPRTLEQLIVLVLRETARKAVHLVNWVVRRTAAVPGWVVGLVGGNTMTQS